MTHRIRMHTDLHIWQEPYVWATSTGATVDNNLYISLPVYYRNVEQHANLPEKVKRYEELLHKALNSFDIGVQENSHLRKVCDDFSNMANSYYADGMHFVKEKDLVNALVCFSYGHAWLDAGVKLGVFRASDENLFTV